MCSRLFHAPPPLGPEVQINGNTGLEQMQELLSQLAALQTQIEALQNAEQPVVRKT
jgi:hypothetical protein